MGVNAHRSPQARQFRNANRDVRQVIYRSQLTSIKEKEKRPSLSRLYALEDNIDIDMPEINPNE